MKMITLLRIKWRKMLQTEGVMGRRQTSLRLRTRRVWLEHGVCAQGHTEPGSLSWQGYTPLNMTQERGLTGKNSWAKVEPV